MQQLSRPNNRKPDTQSSLQIATDALPSAPKHQRKGPILTILKERPALTKARYTLSELVNLPNEELQCHLKSVESSYMLGDNVDSDLWIIRSAQEFFRRMDSQYEDSMNAMRAELYALFENLENMRDLICGEIRDRIERNCRGMVESNIAQKRTCENKIDGVRKQYRAKPSLMALAKSMWDIRQAMKEIAELDEEFPVERKHGIRIATQGTHVDLDHFDFLPGSQGSEIERYIAQAHDQLNEFDRRQEENGRRVQALIRCEGFCYRNCADKKDWPLPNVQF